MVLIMGLGMQLVGWPDPFCQLLVAARLPRDPLRQPRLWPVEKMDHLGARTCALVIRARLGLPVRTP